MPQFEGTLEQLDNLHNKKARVQGNIEKRFEDDALDNMTEDSEFPF